MIFDVFQKKARHRIHYIFGYEIEKIYHFWKYRLLVLAISPWIANISVSAPKKPYRLISKHEEVKPGHSVYWYNLSKSLLKLINEMAGHQKPWVVW